MARKSLKDKWRSLLVRLTNMAGGDAYLCDSCRLDYRSCNNPERPNATKCPDYRARY